MNITIKVRTDKLEAYIANMPRIAAAVEATARDIEADSKLSIKKTSGRFRRYKRGTGKKSRVHWSAPPYRAPNTDYGKLANSIRTRKKNQYTFEVRANAKYAIPVELGHRTRNGKFVAPRPFLVPSMRRHNRVLKDRVGRILGYRIW